MTAEREGKSFASSGPLETGHEFRTDGEVRDRDPGDSTERLDPDQPGVTSVRGHVDGDTGGANEQQDARRLHGQAVDEVDAGPTDLDPARGQDDASGRGMPDRAGR
ncbi:MAG TPA: hypothetical protein VEA15_06965 [Caulobacteraceae bacterium]|nr:hypothetical protein [Caulobacteraceae bacterium]